MGKSQLKCFVEEKKKIIFITKVKFFVATKLAIKSTCFAFFLVLLVDELSHFLFVDKTAEREKNFFCRPNIINIFLKSELKLQIIEESMFIEFLIDIIFLTSSCRMALKLIGYSAFLLKFLSVINFNWKNFLVHEFMN